MSRPTTPHTMQHIAAIRCRYCSSSRLTEFLLNFQPLKLRVGFSAETRRPARHLSIARPKISSSICHKPGHCYSLCLRVAYGDTDRKMLRLSIQARKKIDNCSAAVNISRNILAYRWIGIYKTCAYIELVPF